MRGVLGLALLAAAGCAGAEPLPFDDGAATCGSCHAAEHAAFERSAHAHSSGSEVFQAMLPRVEAAWGALARRRCEGCHAPRHAAMDTDVTCISCHAAVGNHGTRDGLLVVDTSAGMAGPSPHEAAPHATRPSGLLASPELCGTCHEITGPGLFDEPTFTEHVASPAFADGEHCIDCHAPPVDGAQPGSPRDHALPGTALLASALSLRARREGDTLVVEVENVARGHDVPTGIASLREVGVDVSFDGRTVRAIDLGDRPMRGTDEVALPTDADHIERRRLAPLEIRAARLPVPPGTLSIVVTLRSRPVRADASLALGLTAAPLRDLAEVRL